MKEELIKKQDAIDAIMAIPNSNWTSKHYANAIKAVKPTQQWIPVSERLPEPEGDKLWAVVLACTDKEEVCFAICSYSPNGNYSFEEYGRSEIEGKIIAWMPVPAPVPAPVPYKATPDEQVTEVKAYQCTFCGFYSKDRNEVVKHAAHCRNNPDYTQECLHCHNLDKDFKQRILFPETNGPYCSYLYNGGTCPYKNHTTKELMDCIEQEKERLSQYGIVIDHPIRL